MSLFPPQKNFIGQVIDGGDQLILEACILDEEGDYLPLVKTDPDNPEVIIRMVLNWNLDSRNGFGDLEYDESNGVHVVDSSISRVRLTVPKDILTASNGYIHFLMGHYDNEDITATRVLARGPIDLRNT